MSQPESDPNEQTNISGADFAIMCDELKTLRAELAEARRQLKEASEQVPVGCMSPEQFSILTGDPVDNGVHVRIWQVYNPPSRAKSGVKLYAAPVPQPAVPEAVARDADWNHVPVGRVIGDPVWAGQLWRSQIQGTKKLRNGDLVYIRPAAILSATDS